MGRSMGRSMEQPCTSLFRRTLFIADLNSMGLSELKSAIKRAVPNIVSRNIYEIDLAVKSARSVVGKVSSTNIISSSTHPFNALHTVAVRRACPRGGLALVVGCVVTRSTGRI